MTLQKVSPPETHSPGPLRELGDARIGRSSGRSAQPRAPAVFVSHGINDRSLLTGFARALRGFGTRLGEPRGVVVMSSDWDAMRPVRVTGGRRMTLEGAGDSASRALGMPASLPGSPPLAQEVVSRLAGREIPAIVDMNRPLDEATWLPVFLMFAKGRVPVVQVSIPMPSPPELLEVMGQALAPLRYSGVVLLGSGGIVHNVEWVRPSGPGSSTQAWAVAFDEWMRTQLEALDVASILAYRARAPHAHLAAPTPEHLHPLFFVLGARAPGDRVHELYEGFTAGSVSLRSFVLAGRRREDRQLPQELALPRR